MNPKRSDYRRDIKVVDSTLLNLIKGRIFILIVVSMLILGVLYFVAKKILSFGQTLDYSPLKDTAVDSIIEYLEKYDTYFWWAIVIIIALFVLSFINHIVRQSLDSFSKTNVPMPVARNLFSTLSPMALEVLAWVWHERREPLKVNDLKLLSRELKQGRFSRIEDAREQERLLSQGLYGQTHTEANQVPIASNFQQSEIQQVEPILNEHALSEPTLRQNDTVQIQNDALIIKDESKA